MDKTLLFFYGLLISAIFMTGVVAYARATIKESKKTKTNHSNYGSG